MSPTLKPGITTYATPTDREIVVTRVVNAPRSVVFELFTRPEHVARWLLGPEGWTMPVCEIDLRPGGRWKYVYRKSSGTEMTLEGAYREVVPPVKIVATESWGPEWPETVNTTTFTEQDGQTTITMTMLYASRAVRDAALDTGMRSGIEASFDRLDEMVSRG